MHNMPNIKRYNTKHQKFVITANYQNLIKHFYSCIFLSTININIVNSNNILNYIYLFKREENIEYTISYII